MLKKIAALLLVLIIGAFCYYKFWVEPQLRKNIPLAMSQMQTSFEEMCNKYQDSSCLASVQAHYQNCSSQVMPKNITLASYKKDLKNYLNNVHACIEKESSTKLPSIWDYWAKYEN